MADWRALPDEVAHSVEMRGILERAIAALPDLYRNVLLLRASPCASTLTNIFDRR